MKLLWIHFETRVPTRRRWIQEQVCLSIINRSRESAGKNKERNHKKLLVNPCHLLSVIPFIWTSPGIGKALERRLITIHFSCHINSFWDSRPCVLLWSLTSHSQSQGHSRLLVNSFVYEWLIEGFERRKVAKHQEVERQAANDSKWNSANLLTLLLIEFQAG